MMACSVGGGDRLVYFFRRKPFAHCRATRNRLHPHERQTYYRNRPKPYRESRGSSSSIAPTEAMLKAGLSLGMSVTLAGGVDKVKGLSIEEIEDRVGLPGPLRYYQRKEGRRDGSVRRSKW